MNGEQLTAEILKKAKEIRSLLEENAGGQYLYLSIHEDGTIAFFNKYFDEASAKGIKIDCYVRGI